MARISRCLVLAGVACLVAWGSRAEQVWGQIKGPVDGRSQSIGGPAAGCLLGAVALPLDGEGYQVLRPQRNRFWGHARTIDFIADLARKFHKQDGGLILVGDMSQPRGGPMPFGHGSHQHGLDVDIWFKIPASRLSAPELEKPIPISMVRGTKTDPAHWGLAQLKMLELAARDSRVDRIFVNPPIKVAACKAAHKDRAWLSKLRPWWGHDEHFHVRLACAEHDPLCQPQAPVPDGDGCGAELASWNAKPALIPLSAKDKPNGRHYVLPSQCQGMVTQEAALHEGKD